MQRFLLLAFLVISLDLTAQQSFSHVSQEYWDNYLAIAKQGDALAAVGFTGQCDFPKATGLNSSTGSVQWEVSPSTQGYGRYADVAFAADGSIWAAGWIQEADDVSSFFRAVLTHIDPQGNILSHREVMIDQISYEARSSLVLLPDGQIFWNIGTDVHLLDTDGNTLNTWPSPSGNLILQLAAISADFFLVATEVEVYRIDTSGVVSTYLDSDLTPFGLVTTAEQAWWLVGDQYLSWDYATQEERIVNIDQSVYSEPRAYLADDGNIIIHSTLTPPFSVGTINPTTNEITDLASFPATSRLLYEMLVDGDDYYLLGGDLFEGEVNFRKLQHGFVEYREQGIPSQQPDLGVTGINITLDSFELSVFDEIFYRASCDWSGEIEVRNFSNIPVERFLLASPVDGGFNCAEGRFLQEYEVNIPPQASVVVPFTYRNSLSASVDEDGDVTIEFSFCAFTAAPEAQLDANPLNNLFCETFIVVDAEEPLTISRELLIFPNPTSGTVVVQQPGSYLEKAQLFDLTGRLVMTQILQQQDQAALDLSQLLNGQYFLLLQTDQGLSRRQISVQQ